MCPSFDQVYNAAVLYCHIIISPRPAPARSLINSRPVGTALHRTRRRVVLFCCSRLDQTRAPAALRGWRHGETGTAPSRPPTGQSVARYLFQYWYSYRKPCRRGRSYVLSRWSHHQLFGGDQCWFTAGRWRCPFPGDGQCIFAHPEH